MNSLVNQKSHFVINLNKVKKIRKKKQKANPSCRKRHFVDEDPKDPSKRRRTDLMQLIARELEQRYGINWQTFLPIEVKTLC